MDVGGDNDRRQQSRGLSLDRRRNAGGSDGTVPYDLAGGTYEPPLDRRLLLTVSLLESGRCKKEDFNLPVAMQRRYPQEINLHRGKASTDKSSPHSIGE
jgi:hypothetical protein